ncbi:hypothetical protein ADL35_12350 [Streptomyces sp. NRRL WC-3753]|nr:hypothetical protein ADL35_12350 [Streptomyces sp. NRRL WC-3753]
MNTRAAAAAALTALALTLTACSSSDQPDKPTATVTATTTATATVDTAAARQACIDAWVEALDAGNASATDEPTICDQVPGQSAAMHAEALLQRNKANRDAYDACIEDPTDPACAKWSVPSS